MKKKIILLFLLLCVLFPCIAKPRNKPRPLDIKKITENIPIYSLNLLVNKNIDTDYIGEAIFKKLLIDNIDDIKNILAERGINIDIQNFFKEYNTSKKVEFEEMKITPSFIVHRYYWQSNNKPDLYVSITISPVKIEDGSSLLEVTIIKNDPDYEPGYISTIHINIKITS